MWVLAVVVLLILLVIVVQGLAGFYTNFLWYHWTGVGEIWGTVIATKVALATVFVVAAFALLWTSLYLVDKIAPRALFMAPDTELVRRYQAIVGPHAFALRTVVSFLLALVLGAGTYAQWQHWLLFEHAVSFGTTDPLFHRDASFFVFRLPFLSFLVDWLLVALLVALIVSAIGHFLNGAIRFQSSPRIEPRALAHLSLLLGLMALVRAWAYYFVDRFTLDLSSNGYVNGAGYTDVHVRLPAMTLLAVISLAAFAMLVFNAYQRSLVLPAIAVGLWAFLALVIGVIYPAAVQAFRVTPAQSTLERPYIQDNINATRFAMGLSGVQSRTFPANEDLTPDVLARYQASLQDAQVWDPIFTKSTFDKLQDVSFFFTLTNLTVDRYKIGGKLTPMLVGVRELNTAGSSAARSWVNAHLQYTHGYAAVMAPANSATGSPGTPDFVLGYIPPTSQKGAPQLRQPEVYFAPGETQYVVADTKVPEVNFQTQSASSSGHYKGDGGIPIGSFISRAAFAIHLKDFNLLISNEITPKSRLVYIPDIRQRVQKALPFLQVDSNPYAVVDGQGQLEWMVDAYTTTSYYPYGQPASTSMLPGGSGLAGPYDYVRDAVKVVVNAYTGKMHFYVVNGVRDPLIESYERAFPHMFEPMSAMSGVLKQHLRYPQDLLTVQASTWGSYHLTSAAQFYNSSGFWDLSQISTSPDGSPSKQLQLTADGSVARYLPIYELLQLPGDTTPTFNAVEPLVPISNGDRIQTLAAMLFADSSFKQYGRLEALDTASTGRTIDGPGIVSADILDDPTISKAISLLDQGGSVVTLGTVQELPIADSLLYVRPLYVSSAQTQLPRLVDVIVVYGKQIVMEPTLGAALLDLFGTQVGLSAGSPSPSTGTGSNSSISAAVRRDIAQAYAEYTQAQKALAAGDLGAYQADVTKAGQLLAKAQRLLASSSTSTKKAATPSSATSTGTTQPTNAAASGSSTSSAPRGGIAKDPNVPASGPIAGSTTTTSTAAATTSSVPVSAAAGTATSAGTSQQSAVGATPSSPTGSHLPAPATATSAPGRGGSAVRIARAPAEPTVRAGAGGRPAAATAPAGRVP